MPIRARHRSSPVTARALLLLSVAALVALLAGCGSPEYTYVTNSTDRTYLKVPASWRPIDDKAMNDAIGFDPTLTEEERGLWFEAYDADADPSPMHLFGPTAAAPAAFVGVQPIPESARGQFYPVSASAQEAAEMDPTSGVSDLALVADEVLTPGNGLRGVHSVFRYRVGDGPMQMMDQTAYLNDDASKLYMFFVRCSTECYEQRQKEIGNVVSSFTVRETT